MKCNPLGNFSVKTGSRAIALSVALAATVVSSANAAIYAEIGDTGDIPFSAQDTQVGSSDPSLTQITGTLSSINDRDMYLIYISDAFNFSVTTTTTIGGNPAGDAQLFLFNDLGLGVVSADDPAGIPMGGILGLTEGYYYLAITAFDAEPVSQPDPNVNQGQFIFGQTSGLNGPTGAGGSFPIIGWSPQVNPQLPGFDYTINLTGAEGSVVPDSGTTLGLLGLSLGGLFLGARKLKAKA